MNKLDNAFALIIGVDYEHETETVHRDAQAIYDVLTDEKLCGYDKENVTLLIDKDATVKNILKSLEKTIAKSNKDSSFLLYYSGHGGYEDGTSWLCPYDFDENTYITGKELREQLAKIKSKRMFILFDCCHSGSFFQGKDEVISQTISGNISQGSSHRTSSLNGLAQEIDDEQGMVIVASSQADERSWGSNEEDNSIFTQSLLEAFKAVNLKNKRYLPDEFVRTIETVNYVFERTPKLFRALKKTDTENVITEKMQMPYANLQMSADFPICYIPEELRHKVATNKFPKTQLSTPKTSKSNEKESWERDEGNNLLLFIHGFSGESKDTFGDIPRMLQADSNFNGWAMKPLGYSPIVQPKLGKDIWGAILDVDKIASYLATSIGIKFKKYDRIAIISHSLGGLVAQKAILELDEVERKRISHLIMFGTPSNGISTEMLSKQWNSKYQEMSSDGTFITSLRNQWSETFKDGIPFKLKVAAATEDQYVSMESCHGPFAKEYCEFVDNDHLRMVKPKDKNDDAYNLILNTLTNNEFYNKYTNREEINILLGKYDAVVKELLPRKYELDDNGVRQLIFSLEGLDRKDEAIKILNEHPEAKGNTDLMGILGGRYKRAYLNSFSKKDGDQAFNYYSKALEMAVNAKVDKQIYYHAINLAFLSIVMYNDESKMTEYAEQALAAANKCRNDLWKIATIAEASMYIDDMDKAMEFYEKAAKMADIRQKISIHTNAYAGYVALMQTTNEDDPFIQFLKTHLLG